MSIFEIKTQEDFERAWIEVKAHDAKMKAEWDALPEDEKKRRRETFDPRFVYRMTSPVTDDCIDPYDEDNFKDS